MERKKERQKCISIISSISTLRKVLWQSYLEMKPTMQNNYDIVHWDLISTQWKKTAHLHWSDWCKGTVQVQLLITSSSCDACTHLGSEDDNLHSGMPMILSYA